jgi:hypothetical protein
MADCKTDSCSLALLERPKDFRRIYMILFCLAITVYKNRKTYGRRNSIENGGDE